MNTRLPRILTAALLLAAVALGTASPARAAGPVPSAGPLLAKLSLKDLAPKVTFKAGGSLKPNKASIVVTANITVAGKTFKVNVLNMGIAKSKKSVTVKRKIGKLKVSLKISWSGTRTLTVKGTAKYLRFKIPFPKLKIRL